MTKNKKWLGLFLVLSAGPVAASQYQMRFAEFKTYREVGNLPPELRVTFNLECNEKLLRTVREEVTDATTSVVTIGVGGVVLKDLSLNCDAPTTQIETVAGKTFSGRQYEVVRISN